jgi:hypothetical protein
LKALFSRDEPANENQQSPLKSLSEHAQQEVGLHQSQDGEKNVKDMAVNEDGQKQ